METEVPLMLRRVGEKFGHRFTFHSSRMRMKQVTPEELRAMDADSDRCALELSDAHVDVLGYACLVAIMSMGHGYHRQSEARLHQVTIDNGCPAPVVSSAGALVESLHTMGAKRVSILTPYMKPLTKVVADYIESEGITVKDALSLEIPDNVAVGLQSPLAPAEHVKQLDTRGVDAVALSACVQMPSFESVQRVEDSLGIPVVTASICTVYQMLQRLGLERELPGAGSLLSGRY
ncbi:MAG: Asp/Glu racemase [Candidimonas sp.]|nr:MAG: Asp/Glu racemase [Candidimonas sp.]